MFPPIVDIFVKNYQVHSYSTRQDIIWTNGGIV